MLAFVANTTASWESFMNTTDNRENDRIQDLLTAGESAGLAPRSADRLALLGSFRAEQECGTKTDFWSRFLPILLRALSVWTV